MIKKRVIKNIFFLIVFLVVFSQVVNSVVVTEQDLTFWELLRSGLSCEVRNDFILCSDGMIYNEVGYKVLSVDQVFVMCLSDNPALVDNCWAWAEALE